MQVVGRFVEYGEPGAMGDVTTARRMELPRGKVSFVVEHEGPEEGWSLRLSSKDGRSFTGTVSRPGQSTQHEVEMTLWRSPNDETQWLLLGSWIDEDDTEVPWAIELSMAPEG